jgi:hypothetical protein
MTQIRRRDFIKYTSAGIGLGIAGTVLSKMKGTLTPSAQTLQFLGSFDALVFGNPSSGYTALADNGSILFQGTYQDGSGTCGIYEAIQYALQNGYGRVGLLGQFYPVNSPSTLPNGELWVDGNGVIFLSPPSVPFALWLSQFLSPSLSLLWYRDVGVVNRVLGRRRALSPSPYLIFPTNNDALIFSRGSQALGQPSAFTASVWISGTPNNNGGYALTYGSLDGGIGWSVRVSDNRVVFLSLSSNAPSSSPFHVAVVYSNGYASLFVNGQLASSGPLGLSYPSQAQLWIGDFPVQNQQAGVNPTNGQNVGEVIIENVQLYSSPLSQSQVEGLASSPSQDPVDYSSLVFWGLYRYIHYLGDLVTGVGFQRMGALLEGGVV